MANDPSAEPDAPEPSVRRPPRRTRSPGWWIRAILLAAWVGLYGFHAGSMLLPVLGLVEQHDPPAIIQAHLDKRYRYDLLDTEGTVIGQTNLDYQFIDGSYEVSMLFSAPDVGDLPRGELLLRGLRPLLGGAVRGDALTLQTLIRLDDRFRLTAVEVEGSLLGVAGSFNGRVTHRGLVGDLQIPALNQDREITVPGFDSGATAGSDLIHSLPPGLEVGDRVRSSVVDFQILPPDIVRRPVYYRVIDRVTTDDDLVLNTVVLEQDQREIARMHADRDGVIHDSVHHERGLSMRLAAIYHQGQRVWPEHDRKADDRATTPPPTTATPPGP